MSLCRRPLTRWVSMFILFVVGLHWSLDYRQRSAVVLKTCYPGETQTGNSNCEDGILPTSQVHAPSFLNHSNQRTLLNDSVLSFISKPDDQNNNNNDITENNNETQSASHTVVCRTETIHVAFVKVHKAGSTTVMNIFERFAFKRDLFLALPPNHNTIYNYNNLFMPPPGGQFDMLINHVRYYDREAFAKVVPKNSKYIGIIREPLDLTISAFEYYGYLYKHIQGDNTLKTYMSNREKYEFKHAGASFTNNRMSFDFGLDSKYFHDVNKINEFLVKLDSEMDLVMVLERFAESLILLKIKFCWQMKDILYITRNKNGRKRELTFTREEIAYHHNFSLADNMLYDHFTQRFQDQLDEFDQNSFQKEVNYFKSLLVQVSDYCPKVKQNNFILGEIPLLVIGASPFNERFNVTTEDCRLMTYQELTFCDVSRGKQEKLLRKFNSTQDHLSR